MDEPTGTRRRGWRTAALGGVICAAVAVLGVGSGPALAEEASAASVTTATTVNYDCFVTFQGGSTTVQFGLTYQSTAPARVYRGQPFGVVLDAPTITPNPDINIQVQGARVVYRLPTNARLLAYTLSGGHGLGGDGASARVEDGALILRAPGPFRAGEPFDLPNVNLLLLSTSTGTASVDQGGTTLADPAFSWIRTDPDGSGLRPFSCFAAAPVALTSTSVGR